MYSKTDLNLVVLESKRVIVRSESFFLSHKLKSSCSDISVGKKVSGSLKLSLVEEFVSSCPVAAFVGRAPWDESEALSAVPQLTSSSVFEK